jgi:hypothetical protein
MRFASIVASILIVASAAFSAATTGIIGTPTVGDGNNRASITGALSTVAAVASGDTLMFGASRDSVTAKSNSYTPWSTSLFNVKVPNQYEYVVSNKDSLQLCVVGAGDADTTAMTAVLQARVYGSTPSTSVWVAVGSSATLSFLSTAETQECALFRHPKALNYRFRLIGAGSTDTTDVRRFNIYDK